jgi:hypothetical protein
MQKTLHLYFSLLLILSSTIYLGAQCPSNQQLSLTNDANNGHSGLMFDVEAINTITLTCFDAPLYNGTARYEIYFKAGTHLGFEEDSVAWTMLGQAVEITSTGTTTNIPIPVNVTIPEGQTYAFYITSQNGGGLSYTDGTNNNVVVGSNSDFKIYEGTGKDYLLGANYPTKRFNGNIHYMPGVLLSIEYQYFNGLVDERYNKLSWGSATETESNHFEVERSPDAISFEKVGTVAASGYSRAEKNYSFRDLRFYQRSYYRLKLTDNVGGITYSDVITIDGPTVDIVTVFPNPTVDEISVISPYVTNFRIVDRFGRVVEKFHAESGATYVIDIADYPAGVYYLADEALGKKVKIVKNR